MSWEYDGEFVAKDDDALVDWAIDNVEKGTEVGLYFKRVYDDERERFGDDHDYLCHFDMGGGTGFPSFGDWFRQCIDTIDMDLRWVEDDDEEDIEG